MRIGFSELEWVLVNNIVVPIVSPYAVGKPRLSVLLDATKEDFASCQLFFHALLFIYSNINCISTSRLVYKVRFFLKIIDHILTVAVLGFLLRIVGN